MSEDDVDSLIGELVEWIEKLQPIDFDDDEMYEAFCSLVYSKLDKFCTKECNYN